MVGISQTWQQKVSTYNSSLAYEIRVNAECCFSSCHNEIKHGEYTTPIIYAVFLSPGKLSTTGED